MKENEDILYNFTPRSLKVSTTYVRYVCSLSCVVRVGSRDQESVRRRSRDYPKYSRPRRSLKFNCARTVDGKIYISLLTDRTQMESDR